MRVTVLTHIHEPAIDDEHPYGEGTIKVVCRESHSGYVKVTPHNPGPEQDMAIAKELAALTGESVYDTMLWILEPDEDGVYGFDSDVV